MDPREFLSLADALIRQQSPTPAVCRTVIGRSYYAAFNVIAAVLTELKIPLDKAKDSHREVMDLVVESQDANLKFACDSLAHQKMVRKKADYDMDNLDVETTQNASKAVLVAKRIIECVDRTRSNPVLWQNASGKMLTYVAGNRKSAALGIETACRSTTGQRGSAGRHASTSWRSRSKSERRTNDPQIASRKACARFTLHDRATKRKGQALRARLLCVGRALHSHAGPGARQVQARTFSLQIRCHQTSPRAAWTPETPCHTCVSDANMIRLPVNA